MGRGRKKSYDRDQVLESVMDLFWQKGFEGTSFQQIVQSSGLNRFSLYSEFGDKEQIFRLALNKYLDQLAQTFEALEQEPYGLENIIQYFKQLDMKFFKYGCFMVNTLLEKFVVNKSAYKDASKLAAQFEALILKNLEAAYQNGELKENINPEAVAKFIAALDVGIVVYIHDSRKNEAKDKIVNVLFNLLESIKA